MNKNLSEKLASTSFIISSILFSAKYISASILSANSSVWAKEEFSQALSYTYGAKYCHMD